MKASLVSNTLPKTWDQDLRFESNVGSRQKLRKSNSSVLSTKDLGDSHHTNTLIFI